MNRENAFDVPKDVTSPSILIKASLPSIFTGLAIFYLFVFKECLFWGAYVEQFAEIMFLFLLIVFCVYTTWNYCQKKKLKSQLSVIIENYPHIFIVTNLNGCILYSNKSFKNYFPHIGLQIEELVPHIRTKEERDQFHRFIKSVYQDSNCSTNIDTIINEQGFKVYNQKHQKLILWTFIEEDVLEKSYLLYDNAFQKSIDPKYLFNRAPAGNVILDEKGCVQGYNSIFLKNCTNNQTVQMGTNFIDLLSSACQIDLNHDLVRVLNQQRNQIPLEIEFQEGMVALAYFNTLEFPDLSRQQIYRGYFLQIFDNSEHKKLQQRLAQSQKLQALGQLAGGIAHDFNNLLTAMIGYCDLLLSRHSPNDHSFTDVMQIKQNANRATNLVRQLLAFSRKQTLQPVILDVSETLAELSLLLQRLIGPNITLKIIHGRNLDAIRADRGQFEQVMINLVVNARDAIKDAGTIHLITSNRTVQRPTPIGHEIIQPGEYIQIEVKDDGCGIELKDLNRIFDPFFSTKDLGSGTGLGLSTVYGIIKQTGGYVMVESTPKLGTKFTIILPRCENTEKLINLPTADSSQNQHFRDLTGTGTILLVEDEDAVRKFAARALSDKGYSVVEAHNGQEALSYLNNLNRTEDAPQLLITDVIMPHIDGPTLAKEALRLYPSLKVIYVSGYAEDSFRSMISQDEQIQFLAKPFSLKLLASKVREVFDEIENKKSQSEIYAQAG